MSMLMLTGAGAINALPFVGTGVTVSAEELEHGDFQYVVTDNGVIEITKYTGGDFDVVIPDTIDGKSVTSIGERAFFGCKSLTSLTISDSNTYIGEYAFYDCGSLKKVIYNGKEVSFDEVSKKLSPEPLTGFEMIYPGGAEKSAEKSAENFDSTAVIVLITVLISLLVLVIAGMIIAAAVARKSRARSDNDIYRQQ